MLFSSQCLQIDGLGVGLPFVEGVVELPVVVFKPGFGPLVGVALAPLIRSLGVLVSRFFGPDRDLPEVVQVKVLSIVQVDFGFSELRLFHLALLLPRVQPAAATERHLFECNLFGIRDFYWIPNLH